MDNLESPRNPLSIVREKEGMDEIDSNDFSIIRGRGVNQRQDGDLGNIKLKIPSF